MSEGRRWSELEVSPVANRLRAELAGACQKATVAGSLRRRRDEVGDIEIVVVPKYDLDLFGEERPTCSSLEKAIVGLLHVGVLSRHAVHPADGDKLKRFAVIECGGRVDGLTFELAIATPKNYGNILAIRTGDKMFSNLMVTQRAAGGLMPFGMCQRDGYLWRGSELIECPDEATFFREIGLLDVPRPEERDAKCVERLNRRLTSWVG